MLAPAKVNLFLYVAAPDARGYHPLQSLVMFADIGDEISLSGNCLFRLRITGPFGMNLSAGEDNLVVRAVRRFEAATGVTVMGEMVLSKRLPVASGLGGGTADAGAALKLLRDRYVPDMPDSDIEGIAATLGADGAMCLRARTSIAEGYGERLTGIALPSVACVLVNPGVECSTPAVYRGLDEMGRFSPLDHGFPAAVNVDELVAALKATRNDLQPAAINLQPVIGVVLESLATQPETVLARMSGSGATCFALCRDDAAAQTLSDRMQVLWPDAWVHAGRLG